MSYTNSRLKADIADYTETISGCWLMDFNWRKVKIKTLPAGVEGIARAARQPEDFASADGLGIFAKLVGWFK